MSHASNTSVPFLDLARMHRDLRRRPCSRSSGAYRRLAVRERPRCDGFRAGVRRLLRRLRRGWARERPRRAAALPRGLDVGPGDEVIVPAMTFVATWEAVCQVGATPVPVDVTEADYCLDPDAIALRSGSARAPSCPFISTARWPTSRRCRAVAPRSRHPSSRTRLRRTAPRGRSPRRQLRRAGAFSFYPGKNLGAMGDAGALVTDDADLAARVRALREHGQQRKYDHDEIGWTARLDTIQAVVLRHKLR